MLCMCLQGAAGAACKAVALAGCWVRCLGPACLRGAHPVLNLSLSHCGKRGTLQISIGDLKLRACKAMGLEEGDVRIWDYWNESRHAPLEGRLDDSAQAAKLFDSQDILLEEKVKGDVASAAIFHGANLRSLHSLFSHWATAQSVAATSMPWSPGVLCIHQVDGEFEGDEASGPLLLESPASPMYTTPPSSYGPSSLRTTSAFNEDGITLVRPLPFCLP